MGTELVMYYTAGIAVMFIAAMLAFVGALRRGWRIPKWVLVSMIVSVPAFILIAQLSKYASLHLYADFSHWLDILQNVGTTGQPLSLNAEFNIPGKRHYFSAHFVPLIYLFAIPFTLFPSPKTLIVLNVAIMSSAAIPLYLLARHRTGDRRFALLVAALLLWYPTFQYTTLYEFEMLRFSIPMLFWMLYAWERQRIGWYYAFVILATLVREEVGLTVGMFGVYLFLFHKRRAHGAATALLGFVAFVVITQFVMPTFEGTGHFTHVAAGSFGQFGIAPFDIATNIVLHPIRAAATILHHVKFANLWMLFTPLLLLPLLAPSALLPAFATFGIGLLSGSLAHSSYMLYYVTPSIPFIFCAFLRAWPKVVVWFERCARGPCGDRVGSATPAMQIVVLVGALVSGVFFGPSPLALQFWSTRLRPAVFRTQSFHWSAYRVTDHHRAAASLAAEIPADAIVATQQFLMPRLSRVRGVMAYPQFVSKDGTYRASYVFLDTTNNGLRAESPAFISEEEFNLVRSDTAHWVTIVQRDEYVLYRFRP